MGKEVFDFSGSKGRKFDYTKTKNISTSGGGP
jgi:hypothetical protein